MASGSFNLTKSNTGSAGSYIIGKIVWSSTSNIVGNYSSVTATLYCKKANDSTTITVATSGTWTYSLTINGEKVTGSVQKSILTDWVEIASKTVSPVGHAANGSKTITISGSVTAPSGTSFAGLNTTGSKDVALDTIPRTSSVSATNANIESATTITISRASSSFTHTLTYSFGGLTGTIATKTNQATVAWTVPATFYDKIPNSPSGVCTITCTTYSGISSIGSSTCTFTATANPAICAPTVSISSVDVNNESIALSGNNKTVITGVSNLRVVTTAKANNSSTIQSITAYCGGDTKTGADVTFTGAASAVVYAIVTDSRGYSTRVDDNALSVINYIVPTIIPSITRDTPTGDSVTVYLRGKWYNGSFKSVTNSLKVRVRYHKTSEGESNNSGYFDMPLTINGNDYSATLNLTGLDYKYAYTFIVRLDDAIFTDAKGYRDAKFATVSLSKGIPVFDWGEDDFQFNVPVKLTGGLLTDYVIDEAYDGEWYYRKWAQGLSEAWYSKSLTPQPFTTKLADGLYSNDTYSAVTVDVPSGIFNYAPIFTSINAYSNVVMQSHVAGSSLTWVTYRLWTSYSASPSNMTVQIYAVGRWKQR